MSRSGTREISAARACSSRRTVCARTSAKNQSRKCGAASTTPPPRKYASGSRKFAAMVNSRPRAIACCRKIASALDALPGLDDPAAEPGADDRGHRAALPGLGAEPHVVCVQRGRVPVVVVDDREPEPFGQRAADVEAAPADVAEVGRALGRDD